MNDRVFAGADVAAAVEAAAGALGTKAGDVRFVVLEEGRPARLGIKATPARIAVLMDDRRPAPEEPEDEAPVEGPEFGEEVRAIVSALAHAAEVSLWAEVIDGEAGCTVRLGGPGRDLFFDEDGDVFRSLEHVLGRAWARRGREGRLAIECEGYRSHRDDRLRGEARALGEAVRADGLPRQGRPMNSYERRIVHVTIGEMGGLRSFSEGEGADRRVTIAPRVDGKAPDPDGAGG